MLALKEPNTDYIPVYAVALSFIGFLVVLSLLPIRQNIS